MGVFDKKIYINGYEEHGYCIGEYKTKERALEVLDEIQYKINNYVADVCVARSIYVGELQGPTYIYEMPKE